MATQFTSPPWVCTGHFDMVGSRHSNFGCEVVETSRDLRLQDALFCVKSRSNVRTIFTSRPEAFSIVRLAIRSDPRLELEQLRIDPSTFSFTSSGSCRIRAYLLPEIVASRLQVGRHEKDSSLARHLGHAPRSGS